jgi:hypothetical protein
MLDGAPGVGAENEDDSGGGTVCQGKGPSGFRDYCQKINKIGRIEGGPVTDETKGKGGVTWCDSALFYVMPLDLR